MRQEYSVIESVDDPLGKYIAEFRGAEVEAIGVYGQWIYVNPAQNTIIIKMSADPDFTAPEYDEKNMEFLRSLACQDR